MVTIENLCTNIFHIFFFFLFGISLEFRDWVILKIVWRKGEGAFRVISETKLWIWLEKHCSTECAPTWQNEKFASTQTSLRPSLPILRQDCAKGKAGEMLTKADIENAVRVSRSIWRNNIIRVNLQIAEAMIHLNKIYYVNITLLLKPQSYSLRYRKFQDMFRNSLNLLTKYRVSNTLTLIFTPLLLLLL